MAHFQIFRQETRQIKAKLFGDTVQIQGSRVSNNNSIGSRKFPTKKTIWRESFQHRFFLEKDPYLLKMSWQK